MNKEIIDADLRQQALNPNQSFIVQAPAGSGKTEMLMQRFLVLLSVAKQPEEILSITFTKKASAEMRARIIDALTRAQHEPEPTQIHANRTWQLARQVLEKDQALSWHLLENPNRLKIQTMDSFNAYLTRQLPILARFGGTPEITDHAQPLYRAAVQELLNDLEEKSTWADALSDLLLHLDNNIHSVEQLLITLLGKRDQWLPYLTLDAHHPNLRKVLESHLESITLDLLSHLSALFPKAYSQEFILLAEFAATQLLRENSSSPIIECGPWTTLPGNASLDKKKWLALGELLLTRDHGWRKRIDKTLGFPPESSTKNPEEKRVLKDMKGRLLQLIEHLKNHEELKNAFIELRESPPCAYDDTQWNILQSLLLTLKIAVAQLKLVFQQQGKIDYIENAEAALFALGSEEAPTDITLALDYQIQHILIDEFQDTASSQYRLIQKLTMGWCAHDGRTLFVVGDPMQSIYRFREAEVGLFIRAKMEGVGNVPLIPLTLSVNFRSNAPIVNWINSRFKHILPALDDIGTSAIAYSPSVAYHDQENENAVFLHNTHQQAETITQFILKHKEAHPNHTIAILVRSRSHLADMIPTLREAHIQYRAIEIDPLAERPMVQDLLALTRALLYPADRVALLALLRAPWCGLTLEDLYILNGQYGHFNLWSRLQQPAVIHQLSPDGQARFTRIFSILHLKWMERNRLGLRAWIENTWNLLGGPATLHSNADLMDSKAFFNLLEKIDQNGDLNTLQELEERINRLYAAPNPEVNPCVEIMTIHNAKGLEFDTVILPHLERKSLEDSKQLLLWMEKSTRKKQNVLILAPIHSSDTQEDAIYHYLKRQHKIKNDFELGRLLYVAVTRAKKQLHLFFHLEAEEASAPESNSLLSKLWHPSLPMQSDISPIHNPEQAWVEPPRTFPRLTLAWKNPIQELPSPKLIDHQSKSGFILPEHSAAHIGTVIHFILQQIAQYGQGIWAEQAPTKKYHYLQIRFRELGLTEIAIPHAIQQVITAIENTLSCPRGQWILHPHSHAASEWPITTHIQQDIHSLIIDRTFIDQGIRWIIDYKTSTANAEYADNIELFLEREEKKYHTQLQHYALALYHYEKKPIRLGLYFPLMKAWREVVSEQVIALYP